MSKTKPNKNEISELEGNFLNIWFNNGFNGTGAYRLAKPGCKESTARTESAKILAKPNIQHEIEVRKLAIRNKEDIKLSYIVSKLRTVVEDCVADNDRHHLIKALDMLSKLGGFYTQKVQVSQVVEQPLFPDIEN